MIRLSDEVESRIRAAARREGKNLSVWAEEQLERAIGRRSWPTGYFELFGSVDDESFEAGDEDVWGEAVASKDATPLG